MRLSVSLVAVKKITTSSSPASFDEEKINRLAEQILKAEGIISPLIVRRTSLESYELVEGDFEYFAAVKAREIDPRKGETISAYIIEPENDDVSDAIAEQIDLLRSSESIEPDSQSLIHSIEKSIARQINPLKSSLQDVNTKLDQKVNVPQVSTSKASITQLETTPKNIEQQLADLIKSVQNIEQRIIPPDSKILEDFNNLSSDAIKNKLKAAKVNTALLNKLVESIVKGRPYSGSFTDFVKSDKKKLFTDKGWAKLLEIKILDLW